jgi:hypothetical protein
VQRQKMIESEIGVDAWLYCLYKLNELIEKQCIELLEFFMKDWQVTDAVRKNQKVSKRERESENEKKTKKKVVS